MNQLIHETSPYLLQHAHNPVHWYAWKEEAFQKAKEEDKPILVSIGYSTCHWCHVMERESFEDAEVAAFMNEHFINIKVDREERPDVDQIYMEACQAINQSGGWPLNCFLLPDGRPFYAATYFPPEPAYRRPSWQQVLNNISKAFRQKRSVVEEQADKLTGIIRQSDQTLVNAIEGLDRKHLFTPDGLEQMYAHLEEHFDRAAGGFGGAPKFPSTMALHFLLEQQQLNGTGHQKSHALHSLNKMIRGGIYDQLGGGFARYTVDKEWLVPHFEKMLYDNALLVSLLADAYKATGDALYQASIQETLAFIAREMTSKEGGFYTALDADSEGEEGKFYVWDKSEIDQILGSHADLFCEFYDVSEEGNWEEKNILWRREPLEAFAERRQLDPEDFRQNLSESKAKLMQARAQRIRPGLDDKHLLSWNALQCIAYAKAYSALQDPTYLQAAERNLEFMLKNFKKGADFSLFHTYKNGKAQYDAFLEDYAYLIEALLEVYFVNFDLDLIHQATAFLEYVIAHFYDTDHHLFYFTSNDQSDVIVRKKDIYDSAIPSGNAVMAGNLWRLAILLDEAKYKQMATDMLLAVRTSILRYPLSFGQWSRVALWTVYPV
ncbi:MAG: thioredoxin domain-containing protein, partial [Bacteroidota bacterium]